MSELLPTNWNRICQALAYYKDQGFCYIETPWIIPRQIAEVTFPNPSCLTTGEAPVGSAEQGFMDLMIQGKLKAGSYVSASPCFRPQDEGQPYHQKQFFKVELFRLELPIDESLIFSAREFFESQTKKEVVIRRNILEFDLEVNGLEVGSYGIRTYQGYKWQYGTGLAEPRFTQALEREY